MRFSAVILAGGESRRMGRDKAWLELAGRPLITRMLSVIRDSDITEIFISGRRETDYSSLGYPVLLDRETGCGPLGGIEQGLQAATAPLVLVLAVDLPNMTPAFLGKLASHCGSVTGVIPTLGGQLEPLAAIYPKRCHAIAREALLNRRLVARDFGATCLRDGAVKTFVVSHKDATCLHNWNTPADLPELRKQPDRA